MAAFGYELTIYYTLTIYFMVMMAANKVNNIIIHFFYKYVVLVSEQGIKRKKLGTSAKEEVLHLEIVRPCLIFVE